MLFLLAACNDNEIIKNGDDPPADSSSVSPDIEVSPPSVDFGTIDPADVGTATVTLKNVGDGDLFLRGFSLVGGTSEVTWSAIPTPDLAPGDSVDTVLTWTPTSGHALSDTLRVESDDPDEQYVDVPLSGALPEPDIVVTPTTYDFGDLAVGMFASTTFTVENIGAGPLHVSDLTFAATDSDLQLMDAGALTTLPTTLDAGESTVLTVQYAPSAAGADEGSFEVFSDDPDTPGNGAEFYGNGVEDDPCDGFSQTVDLTLTADDAWQAWIDGTSFTGPGASAWSTSDSFEWEMPCGNHTLAIYATDTANVISGVIAVVSVEGTVRFVSGPSNWRIADSEPASDWVDVTYDDSAWKVPEVCADTSPWGTWPQPYYDQGAQWIWWTSACHDLGQAWFRLDFTVP